MNRDAGMIGCHNRDCVFRGNIRGQATSGSCHCLDALGYPERRYIRQLAEVAKAARYALKAAKTNAPINKQLEASQLLKIKLDELETGRG